MLFHLGISATMKYLQDVWPSRLSKRKIYSHSCGHWMHSAVRFAFRISNGVLRWERSTDTVWHRRRITDKRKWPDQLTDLCIFNWNSELWVLHMKSLQFNFFFFALHTKSTTVSTYRAACPKNGIGVWNNHEQAGERKEWKIIIISLCRATIWGFYSFLFLERNCFVFFFFFHWFAHSRLLALFTSGSSVVSFSLLLLRARYCVSHEQKLSASSARPKTISTLIGIVVVFAVVCLIRPSRRLSQVVLCQLVHCTCGNCLVRC